MRDKPGMQKRGQTRKAPMPHSRIGLSVSIPLEAVQWCTVALKSPIWLDKDHAGLNGLEEAAWRKIFPSSTDILLAPHPAAQLSGLGCPCPQWALPVDLVSHYPSSCNVHKVDERLAH